MSDETGTATTTEEPAAAATTVPEPKPQPDWEQAYKGLQTTVNRLHQRLEQSNAQTSAQIASQTAPLKSGVETLLKQQLGDDGFKAHQEAERLDAERASALAAAQTAQQFIPQAIGVIAQTMRLAGVSEAGIQKVFAQAQNTGNVQEWGQAVNAASEAAIQEARAQQATRTEAQTKAASKDEIAAEANALAERTLRAKGIDKVDLGKGQSIADRGFVGKVKSIDRNTPEGEATYQGMLKEAKRGTLKV